MSAETSPVDAALSVLRNTTSHEEAVREAAALLDAAIGPPPCPRCAATDAAEQQAVKVMDWTLAALGEPSAPAGNSTTYTHTQEK
jgi:hypothetical protein